MLEGFEVEFVDHFCLFLQLRDDNIQSNDIRQNSQVLQSLVIPFQFINKKPSQNPSREMVGGGEGRGAGTEKSNKVSG